MRYPELLVMLVLSFAVVACPAKQTRLEQRPEPPLETAAPVSDPQPEEPARQDPEPAAVPDSRTSGLLERLNTVGLESFYRESDFYSICRTGGESDAYIATLQKSGNEVSISFQSSGADLMLMGRRIDNDGIGFLVKYRWVGAEVISEDDDFPVSYFWLFTDRDEIVRRLETDSGSPFDFTAIDVTDNREMLTGFFPVVTRVYGKELPLLAEPDSGSEVLRTLNHNDPLEVLDFGPERVNLDQKIDFWYRVRSGDAEGWVFGYPVRFAKALMEEG